MDFKVQISADFKRADPPSEIAETCWFSRGGITTWVDTARPPLAKTSSTDLSWKMCKKSADSPGSNANGKETFAIARFVPS